jgi:hypothetical protein
MQSKREAQHQITQLAGLWLHVESMRTDFQLKMEEVEYTYGYTLDDAGRDLVSHFNDYLEHVEYIQGNISTMIGE